MKAPLDADELARFKELLAVLLKTREASRAKAIRGLADRSATVESVYDESVVPYKRRPVTAFSQVEPLFEAAFPDDGVRKEATGLILRTAIHLANPGLLAQLIGEEAGVKEPEKPEDVDVYVEAILKIALKKQEVGKQTLAIQLLDMYRPHEDKQAADMEEAAREENQHLQQSLQANNEAFLKRQAALERARKALKEAVALKAAGKPYTIPSYEEIMGDQ